MIFDSDVPIPDLKKGSKVSDMLIGQSKFCRTSKDTNAWYMAIVRHFGPKSALRRRDRANRGWRVWRIK